MGGYYSTTILRIYNNTTTDILSTYVYCVNGSDFDSEFTPEENFKNLSIPAGTYVDRLVQVYSKALDCPFNMRIFFRDASTDVFRVNQKYAIGEASSNFQHLEGPHQFYFKKTEENMLQVIIEHDLGDSQNEYAEKLNSDAAVLIGEKRFEEALDKLMQAKSKANEKETVERIMNSFQHLNCVIKVEGNEK